MRRMGLDPLSLVSGLLFVGLGLAFLIGEVSLLQVDWRWALPLGVIGLGLLLLSPMRLRGRRRQ